MNLRPLGRCGLDVSPLAFGGNVFGWTVDEKLSFRLLDAWLDAGFNFVDTADMYSTWVPGHVGGESESIIGKWLRETGKRHRVVLATKVGKPMGEGKSGLAPTYIRAACEASLKRLKTDHIDLYQSHDDDAQTPLADTLGAYAELIKAGKVRAIGASNYSAARLTEALDISEANSLPRYECLQPLYNLYDRAVFEAELQPLCRQRGVGVINFSSLASGFLTGKYRSEADAQKSPRGAGVTKKYLNSRGKRILQALDAIAKQTGATPSQIALAWQMKQDAITAPIASATSLDQLGELTRSAELTLDNEQLAMLTSASEGGQAEDANA